MPRRFQKSAFGFGAYLFSRKRRQRSVVGAASIQSLESRALLASAGLSVAVEAASVDPVDPEHMCEYAPEPTFEVDANGVVRVEGTHGDDVITADVGTNGLLTISVNDVVFAVSDSQVSRLEIDAKCGDDLVGVRESVQHPTAVDLGHGNDTAYVMGGPARVSGGLGNDHIVTGAYDDRIGGGDGNDRVDSGAGHDIVIAGAGNDWVEAGAGDDVVHGGDGVDVLFGGAGHDQLTGAGGDDYLIGGSGDDTLSGGSGNDWIFGDSTNSYPAGYVDPVTYAQDFGHRGHGNDTIYGGSGSDAIFGAGGDDRILADPVSASPRLTSVVLADAHVVQPVPVPEPAGNDVVFGGAGNDKIRGMGGSDIIVGGDGDDWLSGGRAHDLMFGDGPDTLPRSLPFEVDISLRAYLLRTSNIGRGNDSIEGNAGNDLIYAGRGNDRVDGGSGHDTIFGGRGDDTLHGGAGNDAIYGGAGDDTIHGGAGDDKLFGGVGDDEITGGSGSDYMDGGAGADILDALDGEQDTIKFDLLDSLYIDGIDELIAC